MVDGLTGGQLATAVVLCLAMVGLVVGGVLAYSGRWAPVRRAMIRDPEGHRLAGALWLGLAAVPAAVLVLTRPPVDRGLSVLHWAALTTLGLLLLAVAALSLNRPAHLTRLLTPRWLLREREHRSGPLRTDGRSSPTEQTSGRSSQAPPRRPTD